MGASRASATTLRYRPGCAGRSGVSPSMVSPPAEASPPAPSRAPVGERPARAPTDRGKVTNRTIPTRRSLGTRAVYGAGQTAGIEAKSSGYTIARPEDGEEPTVPSKGRGGFD